MADNFGQLKRGKRKLKIIACIQARMRSTRLKKKVLKKILGKTMIERILERLKSCREIDGIILATSLNKDNDILARHARDIGLKYYRGSEDDIVDRLYRAAKKFRADALVRVTGDCPLIDPRVIDKMVSVYRKNCKKIDLLTNNFPPTFPHGLDVEIMPLSTFRQLFTEIKDSFYRDWFPCYVRENSDKFRIYNLKNPVDLSSMRWTVDYPEDLVLVREIFKALDKKDKIFTMTEIVNFLKKNPQISEINAKRRDRVIVGGIRSHAYYELKKLKIYENKLFFKRRKNFFASN